MPTYEFRCPDGHEFERFYRKMSDATPEVACPECGKLAVRLLSGGAGIHFKGSGFYLTDYGKNAHRGTAGAASGESKGDASGDESKGGETKADSKSESGAPAKSADAKSGDAKPAATKPAESKSSDTKSSSSVKSDK
jgi:putative FmdB family regulatory protein